VPYLFDEGPAFLRRAAATLRLHRFNVHAEKTPQGCRTADGVRPIHSIGKIPIAQAVRDNFLNLGIWSEWFLAGILGSKWFGNEFTVEWLWLFLISLFSRVKKIKDRNIVALTGINSGQSKGKPITFPEIG
jgi:hypothetical protein